ncbi:MAG: hypothetical protein KC800_03830 [Candidatus Eremiobacteraeota bacterium]|nr:hypothetical protein [Candidatus Eremiobacteraeota bacterium]
MRSLGRANGLSLPEILVAFLIVTVATLALVSVRTFLLKGQKKAQGQQIATTLATTVMTEVEAAVTEDFDRNLADLVIDTTDWPDGYDYELFQTVEGPRLQRVDVLISWRDEQGSREYRLWTKFARN